MDCICGCSSGEERDFAKVEAMISKLIIRSRYLGCARAKALGSLGVYVAGLRKSVAAICPVHRESRVRTQPR